jgi:hypothetical protein
MNDDKSPKKVDSKRSEHPDYRPTRTVRVRVLLEGGQRIFGNVHVGWPDGRFSDIINDERSFLPFTDAAVEGDSTPYDFLTVAKSRIVMVYEIKR